MTQGNAPVCLGCEGTHVRRNGHLRLRLLEAREHQNCSLVKHAHFLVRLHAGTSCWRERLAHDASRDDRRSISSSSGRARVLAEYRGHVVVQLSVLPMQAITETL